MVFLRNFYSATRRILQQNSLTWKNVIPRRSCSGFVQKPMFAESSSQENDLSLKNVKSKDSDTLSITFSNHRTTDFKNIWLRDSCQCEACVHPVTKQKLVNICDLDLGVQPLSVSVEDLSSQSTLNVCWQENGQKHTSSYSAKWLYQFSDAFDSKRCRERLSSREYASILPPQQFWDREIIENAMLDVPYEEFMNRKHGLFTLLSCLNAYGIAIVTDVPLEKKQVLKVAERISFVKQTTYGRTFQVENNPDPKTHLSYTGRRFELHTDLSYMQNAPSVQLLHCLVAAHPDIVGEDAGGISFFADAFHAACWLREKHPHHFDILVNTKLLFTFQDAERGRWFRMERPLIEANHNGDLIEMYWSDFSMRPPLIPSAKIVPFYQAYRCLAEKLNEENSLWKFFLKAGDLVIFNNKRVLHGRDEYDASRVKRHLEGCYLDFQEAMSLFENLLTSDSASNLTDKSS